MGKTGQFKRMKSLVILILELFWNNFPSTAKLYYVSHWLTLPTYCNICKLTEYTVKWFKY